MDMIGAGNKSGRGVVRAYQYPILSLFDEMNRLFEDALPTPQASRSVGTFQPKIDVAETKEGYEIHGEFPGMETADISIELRDNTLTLSGEKRSSHEFKEGERVHLERSFGLFSRSIPFAVEIDEDKSTAEMKNGVLSIRVPKSEKVVRGAKKLSIKAF
jgi:HSP20 family protein